MSADDNRITITALVPGTIYNFRVSAVTGSGRGAEVSVRAQTMFSRGIVIITEVRLKLIILLCI